LPAFMAPKPRRDRAFSLIASMASSRFYYEE
jgi:hypothetical protein